MATSEILNETNDLAEQIFLKLGSIGLWLQAIGLIFVFWLAFQIINWVLSRRRIKKMNELIETLQNIEKKLDKAIKK
ncbi:hypothetical protein J4233_03260 [Candidatus Pacearchaeota archaeon]|nr:hypothetical protein [Candidatus Pacearchaeota archaeon]